MGDEGTVFRAYCGAQILYLAGCPDEPVQSPACTCGCEFLPFAPEAERDGHRAP